MNKQFKIEYNPKPEEYGSEWFSFDDFVEAETAEEAIELAKDHEIEAARNFGMQAEEAIEWVKSLLWRAEEVSL